jgi:hypothetical protein
MRDSERGEVVDRRAEIVKDEVLVTCIWCESLHPPEHPLEFHPVCRVCAERYPLGSLRMGGSHALTDERIDELVTRSSPGNYALGYMDGTTFLVFFVGRADSDLNRRLHEWVGVPSRYRSYAPSAKAACGSRHRGSSPLGAPALGRVGIAVDSSYTRFAFSYAASGEAAFEEECRNYHDLGGSDGLDNEGHPVPPPGSPWKCPVHSAGPGPAS